MGPSEELDMLLKLFISSVIEGVPCLSSNVLWSVKEQKLFQYFLDTEGLGQKVTIIHSWTFVETVKPSQNSNSANGWVDSETTCGSPRRRINFG